jgi:protoporphyrin/coproporphyrin ferrochelatase
MTQIKAPALAPDADADQPEVSSARIGVLIVNLGTPEATDFWSMRAYLKEFLSDRRVIENNSLLWKLIFNVGILTLRPKFKGRDYDKIWNREKNESPLKTITRAQGEKLAAMLTAVDPRIVTDWAMRYGQPSIASKLAALTGQGCDRILILPLYPQYAAATTATVGDEVFRALMTMRRQPSVRFVPPYYNDPVYIEALVSSMGKELAKLPWQPDVILASFHGIPKEYVDKGDPYQAHCIETARLMRESLSLDEKSFMLTFQSRFGRTEWIRPYTDITVKELAKKGVKNLAIVTPGFSADCLETLEEIAVENAHFFKQNGGQNFFAVPCLNDSELGMTVISRLALRELQGWL